MVTFKETILTCYSISNLTRYKLESLFTIYALSKFKLCFYPQGIYSNITIAKTLRSTIPHMAHAELY